MTGVCQSGKNSGRWKENSGKNQQGEKLLEFGDRYEETVRGMLYLHVPDIAEIKKDLKENGFLLEYDQMRSSIADESELVKKYSDDCRFWVAPGKFKSLKQTLFIQGHGGYPGGWSFH